MHPFQAAKGGPDPGNVSSALRSRRKGQGYGIQPGGLWKTGKAGADKQLTQPQLADLLGIEWQQISRIERGFSGCSNELLVPLSEELDVSTDYLLKGVESDSELLRRQISLLMDQLSIFKSQIK